MSFIGYIASPPTIVSDICIWARAPCGAITNSAAAATVTFSNERYILELLSFEWLSFTPFTTPAPDWICPKKNPAGGGIFHWQS